MLHQQDVGVAPLLLAATKIEHGAQYDGAALDELTSGQAIEMARASCRSDFLRAGLSVELARASGARIGADYQRWQTAISDATAFVGAALGCLPTDGNLWLRDAMLTRAIGEDSVIIPAKVKVSAALSRSEEPVLLARWVFLANLQPTTRDRLNDVLNSDRAILLASGQSGGLKGAFLRVPQTERDQVSTTLTQLPRERRQTVKSLLDQVEKQLQASAKTGGSKPPGPQIDLW